MMHTTSLISPWSEAQAHAPESPLQWCERLTFCHQRRWGQMFLLKVAQAVITFKGAGEGWSLLSDIATYPVCLPSSAYTCLSVCLSLSCLHLSVHLRVYLPLPVTPPVSPSLSLRVSVGGWGGCQWDSFSHARCVSKRSRAQRCCRCGSHFRRRECEK